MEGGGETGSRRFQFYVTEIWVEMWKEVGVMDIIRSSLFHSLLQSACTNVKKRNTPLKVKKKKRISVENTRIIYSMALILRHNAEAVSEKLIVLLPQE